MKCLLSALLFAALTAVTYADIQDPPINDYGPTRKLGRSLSNILFAPAEVSESITLLNEREGNSSAASYGVVKGIGRMFFRFGAGWYEFFTFPFPTYKGSYRPFYPDNVPWIHGGYSEFPPELGWETRYRYTREFTAY